MLKKYLNLTDKQFDQIDSLYGLITGSPVNITAIKTREDFDTKHILDSLHWFSSCKYSPDKKLHICDVGSGGGFPGLPLAIAYPGWHLTLIDSIGKKCAFLESAVGSLGLENVDVINSRAEKVKGIKADLVTARGVASVKDVLHYTFDLVHDRGSWLMYKGEKVSSELSDAAALLKRRGLKSEITRIEIPFTRSYLYLRC